MAIVLCTYVCGGTWVCEEERLLLSLREYDKRAAISLLLLLLYCWQKEEPFSKEGDLLQVGEWKGT